MISIILLGIMLQFEFNVVPPNKIKAQYNGNDVGLFQQSRLVSVMFFVMISSVFFFLQKQKVVKDKLMTLVLHIYNRIR